MEESFLDDNDGVRTPIPQAETTVIQVIPKGDAWSKEQKQEVATFLKEKFMHLPINVINHQVKIFADGLTKTLVLYAPNESGFLFELTEKRGKLITLINTNHVYYTNIIEPLKSNKYLKEFAISIEMLISISISILISICLKYIIVLI